MRIRTSEAVSATTREGVMECMADACGWRGKYVLSLTHTLSPSLAPAAAVNLPLAPALAARLRALADGAA